MSLLSCLLLSLLSLVVIIVFLVVVMNKDLIIQSYKALYRYAKLFDNCPSLKVGMTRLASF